MHCLHLTSLLLGTVAARAAWHRDWELAAATALLTGTSVAHHSSYETPEEYDCACAEHPWRALVW